MKSTQTCPKCSGKKIAVIAKVEDEDSVAIPLVRLSRQGYGHYESWVCVACGYAEFYALGADVLEPIAKQSPHQVRIIDADPGYQGPYR
jgi:hypothetical protein